MMSLKITQLILIMLQFFVRDSVRLLMLFLLLLLILDLVKPIDHVQWRNIEHVEQEPESESEREP